MYSAHTQAWAPVCEKGSPVARLQLLARRWVLLVLPWGLTAVSRNAPYMSTAPLLGTRLVSLYEHEARVGAAKTANRVMRLRGSTHVLCIVQTAAVSAWM